jgi:hypothetical protein
MNFILDLLFSALRDIVVAVVTGVASIPLALFTEWVLALLRPPG